MSVCVCAARELEDDGVENIKNPLEDVTAGLLDSSGQQLPLQAVHVKCKLMDLLSQVKKQQLIQCFLLELLDVNLLLTAEITGYLSLNLSCFRSSFSKNTPT